MNLTTWLGHVELPNPVLSAAGCGGSGRELAQFFDLAKLGAFVTPSIMLEPRAGRPLPRAAETPSGLLGATGLPGPGLTAFLAKDLPWLVKQGARTVVSIAGNTVDEYAEAGRRLQDAPGVTAVEVNLACPNAEDRGVMFAAHADASAEVVRAVRAHTRHDVPVIAKLSPDVTDIVIMALACVDAGANALTVINSVLGMTIGTGPVTGPVTGTARPALPGVLAGGLSGPAIRPIAVRCVYEVHAALPKVPIVGVGGVAGGLDALEFILAGASAVGVGATLLHDPSAPPRIVKELEDALSARGIGRLTDAVGLAHRATGNAPRQIRPAAGGGPPAAARPATQHPAGPRPGAHPQPDEAGIAPGPHTESGILSGVPASHRAGEDRIEESSS
jgi:dihydroorotate dehydrogenase (NAD+) catalytic subunit